ncbi:unnamed protein product [Amaranthus hypochondriacus]
MGRAPCCDKANVKKGPWSPEEDAKLKAYIEKFGTGGNWIALPQKIGLKRCGKSCRLRWLNYLRPNIKHGGFTEEEDNIILSLYISIGSRWSIIAAQLPGRTDNDIKNYWNTRLKKKLLGRRKQQQQNGSNGSNDELPTLSSSALERLQLHLQLQTQHNSLSLFNNPTIWPKLHPLIQQKLIQNNLNPLNPQIIQYPNSNNNNIINNNNNISIFNQNSGIMGNNNNIIMNNINKEQVDQDQLENSSLNGSSSSSGLSSNLVNNGINNDKNNENEMGNNNNFRVLKTEGYSTSMQRVLSFQAELNELLGSDDQKIIGNVDFDGINGWWSNSVSTCWDSSSMLYNNNQDYDV